MKQWLSRIVTHGASVAKLLVSKDLAIFLEGLNQTLVHGSEDFILPTMDLIPKLAFL